MWSRERVKFDLLLLLLLLSGSDAAVNLTWHAVQMLEWKCVDQKESRPSHFCRRGAFTHERLRALWCGSS